MTEKLGAKEEQLLESLGTDRFPEAMPTDWPRTYLEWIQFCLLDDAKRKNQKQ